MIRTVGPHRVQLGDVNKGIDKLMNGEQAALMYSDPPWGDGNIKYWATMNKKMTGNVTQPVPLDDFLTSIFVIAAEWVKGTVLIEYGVRWRQMIHDRGVSCGLQPLALIPLQYRGGAKLLPLDLHVFGNGLPAGYAEHVAGSHGYDSVRRAVTPLAQPGKIILDPCCGMGYTAQIAVDTGMIFRGNELNAKRLAKTVARLK
jgi:hypothetical protein